METRRFGPCEAEVPLVGQGTWQIRDRSAAVEALRTGMDLGLTHVDTAESYGTEPLVAEALGGRRDEVFLVTKVSPRNATRRGTVEHCEASLERLGTDHLDVYLLHWPGPYPIEDTMASMAELLDDGKIRMAGVSNHDVAGMEAAYEALGGHPLACNQILYHPGERAIEVDVLPYCEEHGIAVVGYSPFGSGRFPGAKEARDRLAEIGAEHGKSPYQVVLDWLTRDGVFTIPKAEKAEHVRDNAAALDKRLPKDAYEAFDELFPVPEHVQELPTA